jgi:hypothetical protein
LPGIIAVRVDWRQMFFVSSSVSSPDESGFRLAQSPVFDFLVRNIAPYLGGFLVVIWLSKQDRCCPNSIDYTITILLRAKKIKKFYSFNSKYLAILA